MCIFSELMEWCLKVTVLLGLGDEVSKFSSLIYELSRNASCDYNTSGEENIMTTQREGKNSRILKT